MDSLRYVTVRQLADAPGWPSESALRALIFNAGTNGLAPAIRRVGRRVLIDIEKFWSWVETGGGATG